MRDGDHKPYKQGGNVKLRHDEYRLSERDNWLFGETALRRHESNESTEWVTSPGPRGWWQMADISPL